MRSHTVMNRLVGLLASLGVLLLAAGPAQAAFAGRNGLLVLQPAHGPGLVLTDLHGRSVQVICPGRSLCGQPRTPRFSPNGLGIVFTDAASGRPAVVAADGNCMWCLLGPQITQIQGGASAFTGSGLALTLAGPKGLWQVSLTGGRTTRLAVGAIQDAVSSTHGEVGLVARGSIWLLTPGRGGVRWLARGSQPSFAPDGRHLAFMHSGWIWSVSIRGGRAVRLVRGSSPAYSPDGSRLAFVAPGGAVEVASARGRRAQRVPGVQARALDWQPIPRTAARCAVPQGQQVVAQTPDAIITTNSATWWGCLTAVGKRWRLAQQSGGQATLSLPQLAGRFAAFAVSQSDRYGNCSSAIVRFDLASGSQTTPYSLDCSIAQKPRGVDSLALDTSGFLGWHAFEQVLQPQPLISAACATAAFCLAGDALGNVATSTSPAGPAPGWTLAKLVPSFGGPMACVGTILCVAASGSSVLSSTDPTGSWSAPLNVDPSHIIARIACPSSSLCVAVDNAGNVLTSTNPTGTSTADWTVTNVASGFLTGISCPNVSLCVAVGQNGLVEQSTNPGAPVPSWTPTTAESGIFGLGGVSCPSTSLCVAADSNGNVLTSTNPSAATPTWTVAALPVNPGISPIAPVCSSSTLCVIAYDTGVIASSDPTTANSWTATQLIGATGNHLAALTCARASSLCLATDQSGNVFTSTDPTGASPAWSSTPVDVPPCGACIAEQVYAQDDRGRLALDSVQPGPGQVLGNVALAGSSTTLSWTHAGQTESAQLR